MGAKHKRLTVVGIRGIKEAGRYSDGGGLYRIDEGGRGEEEYVGEVHVGDDE